MQKMRGEAHRSRFTGAARPPKTALAKRQGSERLGKMVLKEVEKRLGMTWHLKKSLDSNLKAIKSRIIWP